MTDDAPDKTQPGEIPDEVLPDDVRPSADNPLAEGPLDGEEEGGLSLPDADSAG